MFKKLFGWGQKPQQEAPPPAPAPVEDYGPMLGAFADLLAEIEKMPPGSQRTFKVLRMPAADDQQTVLKGLLKGGTYSFNWKNSTITIVLDSKE